MLVTIEITPETRARVERDVAPMIAFMEAVADGLEAAAGIGADAVRERLNAGELGLTAVHGASGLAGAVDGWMIDRSEPLAAIGVRGNDPAAIYAAIHEYGGTILPRNARRLAIPLTDEARRLTSPQGGLFLLPRAGKPPLLCREEGGQVVAHWVLLSSVTMPARHWLSRGVELAENDIRNAFAGVIQERLGTG